MKKVMNVFVAFAAALSIVSCSNGQNKTTDGAIAENVNVEEFSKRMQGAQLLDVRTPEEWNEGIIEGATLANIYDADFDAKLAKLDKSKPVAVYCKSGGRSGQAMAKMSELGFREVYNLDGGIGAWNSAKKPTVKP